MMLPYTRNHFKPVICSLVFLLSGYAIPPGYGETAPSTTGTTTSTATLTTKPVSQTTTATATATTTPTPAPIATAPAPAPAPTSSTTFLSQTGGVTTAAPTTTATPAPTATPPITSTTTTAAPTANPVPPRGADYTDPAESIPPVPAAGQTRDVKSSGNTTTYEICGGGSCTTTTVTRDSATGRVTSVTVTGATGTTTYSYTYDSTGKISQKTVSHITAGGLYNPLYDNWVKVYDGNGNLISETHDSNYVQNPPPISDTTPAPVVESDLNKSLRTTDSDKDGKSDYEEGLRDTNNNGRIDIEDVPPPDSDADGTQDWRDDVFKVPEPPLNDSNKNGIPDGIEIDINNDGVTDDFNGNGIPDYQETETNGGLVNSSGQNPENILATTQVTTQTTAVTSDSPYQDVTTLSAPAFMQQVMAPSQTVTQTGTSETGTTENSAQSQLPPYEDPHEAYPPPTLPGETRDVESSGSDTIYKVCNGDYCVTTTVTRDELGRVTKVVIDGYDRRVFEYDYDKHPSNPLSHWTDPSRADTDSDGISDDNEGKADNRDSDGDKIPDYKDNDSDNDGTPDKDEIGFSNGLGGFYPKDSDQDGTPDHLDTDGSGFSMGLDILNDTDGDGISNAAEGNSDSDNDGDPNSSDPDSDNDGILDKDEVSHIGPVVEIPDTDHDGIPDYLDKDADNDGIYDDFEINGGGALAPPNVKIPFDTNGNGVPDFQEIDADGDGVPDSTEGMSDVNKNGVLDYIDPMTDYDGDGLVDIKDPNPLEFDITLPPPPKP